MITRRDQWPDLLNAYLQLSAGRGAALPASDLRKRLGPQLDVLAAVGAVQPGTLLSAVSCGACYEGHTAEVIFDPVSRRSSFFCAEAGLVEIADEDLETVRPDLRWLPDQLAQAFNVKPSPPLRTLIEGAAWWLGDIEVGQTDVSVALAIGVRTAVDWQELVKRLQRLPPPNLGLLLVVGDEAPAYITDLTRYQPMQMGEIVRWECEAICILRPRLEAWVRGLLRGHGPSTEHGGRPSTEVCVMALFDERRQRGSPYRSRLGEAKAMQAEWLSRFPDQQPPALSTIRGHLPDPTR